MARQFIHQRFTDNGRATLGMVYDCGVWIPPQRRPEPLVICAILEDTYRPVKIKGRTRIPAGDYELELKPVGTSKFDAQYSKLFKQFHAGMIRFKDVPDFSEILLHCGNDENDTEGCPLTGYSLSLAEHTVQYSRAAYSVLAAIITKSLLEGHRVTWSIRDEKVIHGWGR